MNDGVFAKDDDFSGCGDHEGRRHWRGLFALHLRSRHFRGRLDCRCRVRRRRRDRIRGGSGGGSKNGAVRTTIGALTGDVVLDFEATLQFAEGQLLLLAAGMSSLHAAVFLAAFIIVHVVEEKVEEGRKEEERGGRSSRIHWLH